VSLRGRLSLYLWLLHLAFFGLVLWLYREKPVVVLVVEALLVASALLGTALLRRALQPLDYTRRFSELLQEHNYAAQLQKAPEDEVAGLVAQYNAMLAALYQERLRLGEQRGFLDRLLEATPSAVLVFDFDQRIRLVNPSALALLGITAPEGHALGDWAAGAAAFTDGLDAPGRERSLKLLAALESLPVGDGRLLADADGRRYRAQRSQFFDRGFPRHFLLLEELTEELESSERATYEKLVRVLAHEVNNTVAATGSVLDSLLFYRPQLTPADGEDFGTAIEAVKRRNASLGEFIERFTRVVKMPAPEPRPTDLRALLDDVLRLYREGARTRGVQMELARADRVSALPLDRNLFEQALLNIVKNAVEAAEASARDSGGEGTVTLELVREASRVRLSVIDSGNRLGDVPPGQMFTPFFSTKRGGQGIGLLFVREVLQRHGFAYRLAPDGAGRTRFDIWLPA
jgi:two-component system, NtrC family, nitrogen regulation sensor histidine kinase NtrY